jgi:hypothetical protein
LAADEFAEWLVGAGALLNEDAGFEVMTEEGFICAANRLVDEFGPSDVSDTFSRIAGPEVHTSVMVAYVDAVYVCGDIRRWVASEAVNEIGAALDVELDSEFFDCLVEGLSEEEARDFSKQELSTRDSEKIIDDSIMKWVDLGIHTRADFCAPEFAPVLEALLVDRVVLELIDFDRARGFDFLNEDEYRCAVRRVVDELGVNVVSDVHSGIADAALIEEFGFGIADATTDCVDREKWADEIAEWFAGEGLSALERLGVLEPNVAEQLTPDDISCAARRFVDGVGPKVLNDVLTGAEDIVPFDEFADELGWALFDCVYPPRVFPRPPPTTTTPTPSDPPEEDWDESEVEFDVLNATFKVGCTSPWENEGGPITFSDGEWSESLHEGYLPVRSAYITEIVVDSVDRAMSGEEVVVEVVCQSDGLRSPRFGVEVHVFAGNSRAPRRLGQPVVGFLERVLGDLGGSEPRNGFVSTRVWETLDTDARCCPSKYEIVDRYWSGGAWVQSKREVWERTVYDWR